MTLFSWQCIVSFNFKLNFKENIVYLKKKKKFELNLRDSIVIGLKP